MINSVGAEDGNRTRTPLRTQDFKSWASTNSATPACFEISIVKVTNAIRRFCLCYYFRESFRTKINGTSGLDILADPRCRSYYRRGFYLGVRAVMVRIRRDRGRTCRHDRREFSTAVSRLCDRVDRSDRDVTDDLREV